MQPRVPIIVPIYKVRIDYVSVREDTGKKLVKELTGRDVPVVCDPTLMLTANDWNTIVPSERFYNEKYIFCYFLGNNPEQRDFVKKFATKNRMEDCIFEKKYSNSIVRYSKFLLWTLIMIRLYIKKTLIK